MSAATATGTGGSERLYWLMLLGPCVFLALFYLVPVLNVLVLSFTVPKPGLANYAELVNNGAVQRVLWTTLRIGAITTVLALGIGYVVAYALLQCGPRERQILLGIVVASFWISALIRAFARVALLQPGGRDGQSLAHALDAAGQGSGRPHQVHLRGRHTLPGAWIVPKGNPAKAGAWKFIASAQDQKSQVELFKRVGNGPVNPAAAALVPPEMKALDCGSPENFARQVAVDNEWYAQHYATILARYMDAIAS